MRIRNIILMICTAGLTAYLLPFIYDWISAGTGWSSISIAMLFSVVGLGVVVAMLMGSEPTAIRED
jgi:predicted PurR-regulated permease PerM